MVACREWGEQAAPRPGQPAQIQGKTNIQQNTNTHSILRLQLQLICLRSSIAYVNNNDLSHVCVYIHTKTLQSPIRLLDVLFLFILQLIIG
jgi:hypothetical protein